MKSLEITSEKGRMCIVQNPWTDVVPVVYQISEAGRKQLLYNGLKMP